MRMAVRADSAFQNHRAADFLFARLVAVFGLRSSDWPRCSGAWLRILDRTDFQRSGRRPAGGLILREHHSAKQSRHTDRLDNAATDVAHV